MSSLCLCVSKFKFEPQRHREDEIVFQMLLRCLLKEVLTRWKVVFRSAKERSFAERKTTLITACPGMITTRSVVPQCGATLRVAKDHTLSAKERSFAERKTTLITACPGMITTRSVVPQCGATLRVAKDHERTFFRGAKDDFRGSCE